VAEHNIISVSGGKDSTALLATFFTARSDDNEWAGQQNILTFVEWSKTSRGGVQYDFLRMDDSPPLCSSIYGLCEQGAA
jgi:hypothetical protein